MPKQSINKAMKKKRGFTLLEMVVAIAIVAITAIAFLRGFSTASIGTAILDERQTAKNLAESQMDYIRRLNYDATSYNTSDNITVSYPGYSACVTSVNSSLTGRDGNIQKITIVVKRGGKTLITLEGFKSQ